MKWKLKFAATCAQMATIGPTAKFVFIRTNMCICTFRLTVALETCTCCRMFVCVLWFMLVDIYGLAVLLWTWRRRHRDTTHVSCTNHKTLSCMYAQIASAWIDTRHARVHTHMHNRLSLSLTLPHCLPHSGLSHTHSAISLRNSRSKNMHNVTCVHVLYTRCAFFGSRTLIQP